MKKTLVSLMLVLALLLGTIGVGSAENELTTLTIYGVNRNSPSGPQTGWAGKFFAEHGLQLIWQPESDDRTDAMLASGELSADVLLIKKEDAALAGRAGLLLDLNDYLDQMPKFMSFGGDAIADMQARYSNGTGALYGIPSNIQLEGYYSAPGRNALHLQWSVYAEAGYPEFKTLEDLIPVLKAMQAVYPQNDDGLKVYGMPIYDGGADYFKKPEEIMRALGYSNVNVHLRYAMEENGVDGVVKPIFDDDSTYLRVMKFLFNLNQEGLVNPDAMSLDRSDLNNTKMQRRGTGTYLAGMYDLPGWNGAGFYEVDFEDYRVLMSPVKPIGSTEYCFCISAKSNNVEAALKLFEIYSDPESVFVLRNGTEGEMWEYNAEGKPVLTQRFLDSFNNGTSLLMSDGSEFVQYNTDGILHATNWNEEHQAYYGMDYWDDRIALNLNTVEHNDWSRLTGYATILESDIANNRLFTNPNVEYAKYLEEETDDIAYLRASIKEVVKDGSWKMLFAKDEAEFNAIWEQIKADAYALGYQEMFDYRLGAIERAKVAAGIIAE